MGFSLLVRVCDLDDFDFRDPIPVHTAVFLFRIRIVGNNEQQSVRVFQVNGKLSCPVAGQFVAPGGWQAGDVGESLGCLEFHHPLLQLAATFVSQLFSGFGVFGTYFLQLSCPEEYTHQIRQSIFLLTHRVNFLM
ncbi:MAG: hypothetical protein ACYC4A_02460 [Desulfobulbia bacterium]